MVARGKPAACSLTASMSGGFFSDATAVSSWLARRSANSARQLRETPFRGTSRLLVPRTSPAADALPLVVIGKATMFAVIQVACRGSSAESAGSPLERVKALVVVHEERPSLRGPGNRWGRWGRLLGMGAGHGLRAILRRENHSDRSAGHSIDYRSRDGAERFLATSRATASQIGSWTAQPRRWEHSTITDRRKFH